MMKKQILSVLIFFSISLVFTTFSSGTYVVKKGKNIYIEDQQGERWDVTQAKSLGFKPALFQYGMGKNAFTPLDDSNLSSDSFTFLNNPRIIGISEGDQARAYSVLKLRYHEIANTQINHRKVTVGY
jgi:hypothetical protein